MVMLTAGFDELDIVASCDVYAGAAQDSSAAQFDARGITFRARRS